MKPATGTWLHDLVLQHFVDQSETILRWWEGWNTISLLICFTDKDIWLQIMVLVSSRNNFYCWLIALSFIRILFFGKKTTLIDSQSAALHCLFLGIWSHPRVGGWSQTAPQSTQTRTQDTSIRGSKLYLMS